MDIERTFPELYSKGSIQKAFGLSDSEWVDLVRKRPNPAKGETSAPFLTGMTLPNFGEIRGKVIVFTFEHLFAVYIAQIFKKQGLDRAFIRLIPIVLSLAKVREKEGDIDLPDNDFPWTDPKKFEGGDSQYFLSIGFSEGPKVLYVLTRKDRKGTVVISGLEEDPRKIGEDFLVWRLRKELFIKHYSPEYPLKIEINMNQLRLEILKRLKKIGLLKD